MPEYTKRPSTEAFMLNNYGINLEGKISLVEGRLQAILTKRGFKSFEEFADYVEKDRTGEAITLLVSRLTTNYTYFMREDKHYKFMTDTALPELVPSIPDRDLRIWSAGCSSGEEPYTTAMVLSEYFSGMKSQWDTTVLATDISQKVLAEARRGVYPSDKLNNLSAELKMKYFKKLAGEEYQVKPELSKSVQFGVFNLMEPFPFKKKFHIIFCRNVMIYFNNQTRASLTERYYDALAPGGYLFIGLSETLANQKTRFDYVKPAIYRKG